MDAVYGTHTLNCNSRRIERPYAKVIQRRCMAVIMENDPFAEFALQNASSAFLECQL